MSWFNRLSTTTRYALATVAVILLAAAAYGLWLISDPGPMAFAGDHMIALADYRRANPTGTPAELWRKSLIERGAYLTRAADCTACHTAKGGAPYAGGLAFALPFGTIYSPNITADKDTGIGNWSDAQFLNALHRGIDDDGDRGEDIAHRGAKAVEPAHACFLPARTSRSMGRRRNAMPVAA